MNCRPGDLAYIACGFPARNISAIVTVGEAAGQCNCCSAPRWQVTSRTQLYGLAFNLFELPMLHPVVSDCCLRRINGSDDMLLSDAEQHDALPEAA